MLLLSGLSRDDAHRRRVNVLTHLAVDHDFATFVLWGVPTALRLRMFIEEIAPAVKERVADVRTNRA